jgi:hypothetical protein
MSGNNSRRGQGDDQGPPHPSARLPRVGRQPLVGGEAAWEQARATAIPIWGEGRREALHSSVVMVMAVGRRGAPVRGSVGCRWLGW